MSQRRRYEPDWPNYGTKRRRQTRGLVALVALIITALVGTRYFPGLGHGDTGASTPRANATAKGTAGAVRATATTATTSSTSTARPPAGAAQPVTSALAIVERDGAWVARDSLERRAEATQVQVRNVIDGDTIDVVAAQTQLRVRFYGVDTPERDERCYAEATRRTTELTRAGVILVPDARQQDPGGRELRYVFTLEGHSVDATLVAEGLAKAWRGDGSLRDGLVSIEDRARRERTGCLWSA